MFKDGTDDNQPQQSRVIPATVRAAQPSEARYRQDADDYSRDVDHYHEAAMKGRGTRVAVIVLCTLLALLLACGVAFMAYIALISGKLNQGNKSDGEMMAIAEALSPADGFDEPFYMLLLGSDARVTDTQSRSDTNILVRVDAPNHLISMVSIPRDTKITIKGHGTQKFNAAYAFGGVPGVIEATEELLDVRVSHYAEVDFRSLAALVDAVGGVTVDVAAKIDDYHCDDGDGNHYVIQKGTQHLNGGQALTFARSRHYADGDFTRTSNQRLLVEAIIEQVLSIPITQLPAVLGAAADCVTTDLSISDILTLARLFSGTDLITYSALLPSYTQNINGISFVINDEEKTAEMMELFLAGEDPSGIVSTKTAADITNGKIDTSSVLLFDDDDEVASGSLPANSGGASSSGSNGSGTSSGSSGNGYGDASGNPSSGNGSGNGSGGNGAGSSGSGGDGGNASSGGAGSGSGTGTSGGSAGGSGSGSGSGTSGGSGSADGSTGA